MINFNSGPAHIPKSVIEQAIQSITNFENSGLSILEIGHRTAAYDDIVLEAKSLFKDLMKLNDDFEILFLQGGATLQFAQIPYNFLTKEHTALYVNTGSWSEKAIKEAKAHGSILIEAIEEKDGRLCIPHQIHSPKNVQYIHITSNETITGTQWKNIDNMDIAAPLVADMSSDILSRKIDFNKYALIYCGAQKNLGIAGLTIVFIKKSFLQQSPVTTKMSQLSYAYFIEQGGIPNTPPVFSVWLMLLMLRWIKQAGGLDFFDTYNKNKSKDLYEVIDGSPKLISKVHPECRSNMNVPFFFADKNKESVFLDEAEKSGFYGIRGHRTAGGVRIALYNAITDKDVEAFVRFLKKHI